jgi:hypothetical protein
MFGTSAEVFLAGMKAQYDEVAEEYCWAIAHCVGSGFQLDSFFYTHNKVEHTSYVFWIPTCAKFDLLQTFQNATIA